MIKQKVLFVCIHNSARSQMAQAFLKREALDRFEVESAGITPGVLNPLVVEVMKQISIDISHNTTQSVSDLIKKGKIYDYVIAVCDEANSDACPNFSSPAKKIHWSFKDPSSFEGTKEEILQKTIEVRMEIEKKVKQWVFSLTL